MKIVFVSNYLTIHQIPFCDNLYNLLGKDFRFVATETMSRERIQMGWANEKVYPYEFTLDNSKDELDSADIVLFGSDDISIISNRIKKNRIVIRYSERVLKTGRWHILSLRAWCGMLTGHTRLRNKNVMMLCAGAYAAGDYALFGAYPKKTLKWGYYPEFVKYDENELLAKKHTDNRISVLCVGRLIELKHTDVAIKAVKKAIDSGFNIELKIVGDGKLRGLLEKLVKDLNVGNYVELCGTASPKEVRGFMEKANIFLLTSDFNEGWGAVLNEAMNSGCACIACHAVGAAPYLIKDGFNGLLYKNGDTDGLFCRIKELADDRKKCDLMGINAYNTISKLWNADVAATRFIELCNALISKNDIPIYDEGPLSRAKFLSEHWYKG